MNTNISSTPSSSSSYVSLPQRTPMLTKEGQTSQHSPYLLHALYANKRQANNIHTLGVPKTPTSLPADAPTHTKNSQRSLASSAYPTPMTSFQNLPKPSISRGITTGNGSPADIRIFTQTSERTKERQ